MFGVLSDIDDRIIQATGGSHNGDSAIMEAIHLIEAARLKARWHHKEIASSLDPVRYFLVETDSHRNAMRKPLGQFLVSPFERRVAAAQLDELEIGGQHFLQGAQH